MSTNTQTIWYACLESCRDSRYSMQLPAAIDIADPDTQRLYGDDIADDYWSEHDGYEGWNMGEPHSFAIYKTEDSEELGRIVVIPEATVEFSARSISKEQP